MVPIAIGMEFASEGGLFIDKKLLEILEAEFRVLIGIWNLEFGISISKKWGISSAG